MSDKRSRGHGVFWLERRHQELLPWRPFLLRFGMYLAVAVGLLYGALKLGEWGYHRYEGLEGADALVNAAMILGGMGPVNPMHTTAGKQFAAFYALFSGVFFIAIMSILLTPWVHRLLHHLHAEPEDGDSR